jgi:hypothetical protein
VKPVVDFPVDDAAIRPRQATKRLAIWLRLGIFAFVGVIIIIFTDGSGRIKIPEIQCQDVVVQSSLIMLGIPVGEITEPRYQLLVKYIPIPLPVTLTKMFMKGSRCGQP